MTVIDPLVPVLAGLLVDTIRFLDGCDDDEVDPDCAVKVMEDVASVLKRLPSEQLDRLLLAIGGLAEAEADPGRREFLEAFPDACGLVEET
ncbi:hypothetical protein [Kitasatospora sp. NPDC057015]|uniref:hypothetical protein n=1 Tax=Kitasatospora sp. NPDC057015 TaxID=3346001 RepID=UPI003638E54D